MLSCFPFFYFCLIVISCSFGTSPTPIIPITTTVFSSSPASVSSPKIAIFGWNREIGTAAGEHFCGNDNWLLVVYCRNTKGVYYVRYSSIMIIIFAASGLNARMKDLYQKSSSLVLVSSVLFMEVTSSFWIPESRYSFHSTKKIIILNLSSIHAATYE